MARGRAGMGSRAVTLRTRWPKRTVQAELPLVAALRYADGEVAEFPSRRSECADGPRPCPWARCRYHLAVEAHDNGSLTVVYPDRELEDLPDTCALDVAARGAQSLPDLAARVNLVEEQARVVVRDAQEAMRLHAAELGEDDDDG